MKFDHAGIATTDSATLSSLFCDLFEVEIAHRERFNELSVTFLDLSNGYFELLEPTGDGTISRYLDSHGPGIHHIALQTSDITAALERARAHDIDCIDETPRDGAWGHQVAFLHPRSTGGVLIEFVEH